MPGEAGVTHEERAIVQMLAAAWNAYLRLPVEHADDNLHFRTAIHAAQREVLQRPARREMARG